MTTRNDARLLGIARQMAESIDRTNGASPVAAAYARAFHREYDEVATAVLGPSITAPGQSNVTSRECEDCGTDTSGYARWRCPDCGYLVCSWCKHHIHQARSGGGQR